MKLGFVLLISLLISSFSHASNIDRQLFDATEKDDLESVISLLDQGADPTVQMFSETSRDPIWTSLHKAARNSAYYNKKKVFQEFIKRRVNLNTIASGIVIWEERYNPLDYVVANLNWGVKENTEATILQLLQNGANPYASMKSYTVLNAFNLNLVSIIDFLKTKGIPRDSLLWLIHDWVTYLDRHGYEVSERKKIISLFETHLELLKSHVKTSEWGRYQEDPNTHKPNFVGSMIFKPVVEGWLDVIDFMILHGLDVRVKFSDTSPCEMQHLTNETIFDFMTSKGCTYTAKSLERALYNENYAIAEKILKTGIDINETYDRDARKGCPAIVHTSTSNEMGTKWLLDQGADFNKSCEDGLFSLFETLRYIHPRGNYRQDLANVERILALGALPDRTYEGMTPLQAITSWYGNSNLKNDHLLLFNQAMEILLKAGANPNFSQRNDFLDVPLNIITNIIWSKGLITLDAIKVLLDNGANPGIEALTNLAEQCNFTECSDAFKSFIHKNSVILNLKYSYDLTPLCTASKKDNDIGVRALLEMHADWSINCDGKTAIQLVPSNGKSLKVFKEFGIELK